jgi:hypothetical protein
MIKNTLFLFCLVFSTAFPSEKSQYCPDTKQHILPPCFGYFENLYFDAANKMFFTLGKGADPSKAVYTQELRGFSWRRFHYLPLHKRVFDRIPGLTLILLERPQQPAYYSHFYHMLEHLIGLWSFGGEDNRDEVNLFLIAGDGNEEPKNWRGLNDINLRLIQALFPKAQIRLFKEFVQEFPGEVWFERVLTSDRCMEYLKKEPFYTERMLGEYYRYLIPERIEHLAKAVHEHWGIKPSKLEKLVVTYVRRYFPRCLRYDIEKELLAKIKQLPHVELRIVDFAFLPFKDQIYTLAHTDILLGVHGIGLSHTLFLPKGATLIELFPKDCLRVEYRICAQIRGLQYWGMMSGRGWIDDHTAENLGAFGNMEARVEDIDIDAIVSVILTLIAAKHAAPHNA